MPPPDEVIHQTMRLKVMAALYSDPRPEWLDFASLKRLAQATDGNLGSHLATLEKAGYIQVEKDFVGKKPRTRIAITTTGRRAFREHVEYLRGILEAATPKAGERQ